MSVEYMMKVAPEAAADRGQISVKQINVRRLVKSTSDARCMLLANWRGSEVCLT